MMNPSDEDLDEIGLISGEGVEIDTSILNKYFPTQLVYRKSKRTHKPSSWQEDSQQANLSSTSSLTTPSSSDYESELDGKDINISIVPSTSSTNLNESNHQMNYTSSAASMNNGDEFRMKTNNHIDLREDWRKETDRKFSIHNDNDDDDDYKIDDEEDNTQPESLTHFQQLTNIKSSSKRTKRKPSKKGQEGVRSSSSSNNNFKNSSPSSMFSSSRDVFSGRKTKPSQKKRQQLARLIARKEHAEQVRRRNVSNFGEYSSTLVYTVVSVAITLLILHFLGYSKDIQPVITLQLWLVFGFGSVVVLFLLVEAFYVSRPLFVKINRAMSSSTSMDIVDGNVEIPSTTISSIQDENVINNDKKCERKEGTMITSISTSSIDIYDGDNEIDDVSHHSTMSGSGGGILYDNDHQTQSSESSNGFFDRMMRSPMVRRRPSDELEGNNPSSKKLSPMSALESN